MLSPPDFFTLSSELFVAAKLSAVKKQNRLRTSNGSHGENQG